MRTVDIEIGGEYALVDYAHVAKVCVLETGLPGSGYGPHRKSDGVRFELVEATGRIGGLADPTRTTSRNLHPWTPRHEERIQQARQAAACEAEVEAFAERSGLRSARLVGYDSVALSWEDFTTLVARLELAAER